MLSDWFSRQIMYFLQIAIGIRNKAASLQHFATDLVRFIAPCIQAIERKCFKAILCRKCKGVCPISLPSIRLVQHNSKIRERAFRRQTDNSNRFLIFITNDYRQQASASRSGTEFFQGTSHFIVVSVLCGRILPTSIIVMVIKGWTIFR